MTITSIGKIRSLRNASLREKKRCGYDRFTIRSIATRNGTHSHAGRTHRHRMNRESDAHTPYSGYRWCSHNGLAS